MRDYEKLCSEAVMKWYGWGSPVGLSIFFVGMGGSSQKMEKIVR